MSNLLGALKSSITSFTSSLGAQAKDPGDRETDHEPSNSPSRSNLQPSTAETPAKRPASPTSSTNKRPRLTARTSEEEERLVENHKQASGAIRIPTPTEWDSSSMKFGGAGQFKPRNTLSKPSSHTSKRPLGQATYGKHKGSTYSADWVPLDTERVTGSNVPSRSRGESQSDAHDNPPSKKRRISDSTRRPAQNVIDIEDEDEIHSVRDSFDGTPTGVVTNRRRANDTNTSASQESFAHYNQLGRFSQDEFRSIDRNVNLSQSKRTRKPKDPAHRPSQINMPTLYFAPSTSACKTPRQSHVSTGTRDAPVDVDEDSPEAARIAAQGKPGLRRYEDNNATTRHLTHGKLREESRPQLPTTTSPEAINQTVATVEKRRFTPSVLAKPFANASQSPVSKKRPGSPLVEIPVHSTGTTPKRHNDQVNDRSPIRNGCWTPPTLDETSKANTVSGRKESQAVHGRLRMLADTPSVPKTLAVDDEADELHGPSTLTRRTLPQNPERSILVAQRNTKTRSSEESLVPRNEVPFKQQRGHGRDDNDDKGGEKEEDEDAYGEEFIPLKQIWMWKGRLHATQDLFLQIFLEEKIFTIVHNGAQVKDAGNEKPFLIERAHARKVTYSEAKSLKLRVSGSASQYSNGVIWLEFTDRVFLSKFVRFAELFRNDDLKTEVISDDKIEGMFLNTTLEYEDMVLDPAIMLLAKRADSSINHGSVRTARRRIAQPGDNDSLVEAQPRTTRAQRMLDEYSARKTTAASPRSASATSDNCRPAQPVRSTRRSTQATESMHDNSASANQMPAVQRWSLANKLERWPNALVYPFEGAKRTTVEFEDIARLDDGEFLNDNLISFCIRYLQEKHPEVKDHVHFFNTFFYTALTTKQSRKGFNYDAVKRWTKGTDIFTKPFVVVPINDNLHWFLAIICNLDNLSRKPTSEEGLSATSSDSILKEQPGAISGDGTEADQTQLEQDSETAVEKQGMPSSPSNQLEDLTISDDMPKPMHRSFRLTQNDGDSDVYEVEETQDEASQPESSAALLQGSKYFTHGINHGKTSSPSWSTRKTKRQAPPLPRISPDQPVIITLDSLAAPHTTEVRNLKDYVVEEGKDKRGLDVVRTDIKGMTAKGIPQQTNFCDCGVYLVGYLEEFIKDPRGFAHKVLSRELDQNNDFADFDPSAKRAEIREDLLRLAEEQKVVQQAAKKAKRQQKLAAQNEATQIKPRNEPNNGASADRYKFGGDGAPPASPRSSEPLDNNLSLAMSEPDVAQRTARESQAETEDGDNDDEMLLKSDEGALGQAPGGSVNFLDQIIQHAEPEGAGERSPQQTPKRQVPQDNFVDLSSPVQQA